MRGSELEGGGLSRTDPSIRVESVSRVYYPENWARRHEVFARLGGLRQGAQHELLADDDDDTDDDDGIDDDVVYDGEALPDDRRVALDSVSLTIAGGSVGLVGPAGAGKSVLVRVIAGIAPPTEGRVIVRGSVVPILKSMQAHLPRPLQLRSSILLMWKLLDVPVSRPRKRVEEVFTFIGEPELARRHVSVIKGWPVWRRILFGMMLVLEPDILLIDCDLPRGELGEKCRRRILELKGRGTLVVVTGRDVESVAWVADRIVHLRRGRVAADEPVAEVLAGSGAVLEAIAPQD